MENAVHPKQTINFEDLIEISPDKLEESITQLENTTSRVMRSTL